MEGGRFARKRSSGCPETVLWAGMVVMGTPGRALPANDMEEIDRGVRLLLAARGT